MKQASFLFILMIMLGCTHKPTPDKEKSNADTEVWECVSNASPINELEPFVLKGNVEAYDELCQAYMENDMHSSLLPYALLMANKYDYTMAYYDVYSCLSFIYWDSCHDESCSLDSLDMQTRKMALDYLKKAADKGEPNALRDLGWLHLEGKHVKKDTILGNQMLEERSQENR